MNKIIITGRNTKEIELRQLTSGTSTIEFSVAVKRTFKNANGEYDSDFFNCVAFSKTAETISRYVKKGDMLGVVGRLQTRSYTNTEGRKIPVTEIFVENFEFLQSKKQEEPANADTPSVADPFQAPQWEEIPNDSELPF